MWASDVVLALMLLPAVASFRIDPDSQQIVDECGRSRIFHGVNAVEKEFPYLPRSVPTIEGDVTQENSLGDADGELLKGLGMNMVRLGVLITGTMPTADGINATYLSEAKDMVTMLESHGIFTLIDAHQDVLTEKLCGEGIPDWLVEKGLELVGFDTSDPSIAFPYPLPFDIDIDPNTGYPSVETCMQNGFFLYYMSLESEKLWHSIYSEPAMWDAFSTHWAAVASSFAGVPGVLGYEMLNEPWSAMPESNASKNSPFSDDATLSPLYDSLHSAIRAQDNGTLFFFEPLVLGSYEALIPTRATDFPAGGPGADAETGLGDGRSVFAYHSYCPSNPDGSVAHVPLCKELIHASWDGVGRDLKHLGPSVGGFLTEFGAVGDEDTDMKLLQWQTEHADALLQGWSYWTYKSFDDVTTQNQHTETFFNEDGSLQVPKVKALARTYARAIAGKPLSMSFDIASSSFELIFTAGTASSSCGESSSGSYQTEIYLHETFYYASGYSVSLTSDGVGLDESSASWSVFESGNTTVGDWAVLAVVVDEALSGSDIMVTIEAK